MSTFLAFESHLGRRPFLARLVQGQIPIELVVERFVSQGIDEGLIVIGTKKVVRCSFEEGGETALEDIQQTDVQCTLSEVMFFASDAFEETRSEDEQVPFPDMSDGMSQSPAFDDVPCRREEHDLQIVDLVIQILPVLTEQLLVRADELADLTLGEVTVQDIEPFAEIGQIVLQKVRIVGDQDRASGAVELQLKKSFETSLEVRHVDDRLVRRRQFDQQTKNVHRLESVGAENRDQVGELAGRPGEKSIEQMLMGLRGERLLDRFGEIVQ